MKRISVSRPPFAVLVALAVLALLGFQAFFEYRLLAPLAGDTAKLTEDIRQLRAQPPGSRPGNITASAPIARPTTKARLEGVLARLPSQETTSTRIERIHQLASEYGVAVRKASYRQQPHLLILPTMKSRRTLLVPIPPSGCICVLCWPRTRPQPFNPSNSAALQAAAACMRRFELPCTFAP